MSDHQRRFVCRIVFLLLCLLPTGVTGYWICHPQTSEGWAQAIQAELGIETEVGSIETPGPYETILRDVRFLDGDDVLFETVEVRIRFGEQNRITIPYQSKGVNRIGLAYLAGRINQHVLRSSPMARMWRIDFEADTVVKRYTSAERNKLEPVGTDRWLHDNVFWQEQNQLALAKLRIDVSPTPTGSSTTVFFQVRDALTGNRAPTDLASSVGQLSETMTFEIHAIDKQQVVKLNTQKKSLPVWLIDGVAPQISSSLGGESRFAGRFELRPQLTGELNIEDLEGRFSEVDISNYLPTGDEQPVKAYIEIRDCMFMGQQFVKWDAHLEAPGAILRTPIRHEELFEPSLQIAPTRAIARAVQDGRRYASERFKLR